VTRSSTAALGCVTVLLAAGLAGCGHESAEEKAAERGMTKAADESTCRAAAHSIDRPYGAGFPERWPFPPRTTVYHFENRGDEGSIVTAVSSADFRSILAFMNHDVVGAGYRIEGGETEEHDAEAEWAGAGYHGRWAIRESADCPGETVIQVLAGPGD
jgi:hypothetical protein